MEMKMSSWCFFCRSEAPAFTPLSLARASMKIWCIFKGDTAIKWRENATASATPQFTAGLASELQ